MRLKKAVETFVAAVSPTDVATTERELTQLEQRRAQLTESLDVATQNAINASAVRRELVIANRNQQALDEANAKVREAEEQRVALDDALRALDQQIAETSARLEEAKDKAERERVAYVLEHEADAVEKASLAIDKAAKQIASTCHQLRSALSAASCWAIPGRQRLAEDRVVSLLLAEALAGAVPDLFVAEPGNTGSSSILRRGFCIANGVVRFDTQDKQQLDEPSCAHTHAELLITAHLRARAAAIRSGEEAAVLPLVQPKQVDDAEPPSAERHVLFLKPVSYIGKGGQPIIHAAWTAHVPKVVGDLAIERGLALDADTEEGGAKLKEMIAFRQRPWQAASMFLGVEDTVDLGLNLAELREPADSAA